GDGVLVRPAWRGRAVARWHDRDTRHGNGAPHRRGVRGPGPERHSCDGGEVSDGRPSRGGTARARRVDGCGAGGGGEPGAALARGGGRAAAVVLRPPLRAELLGPVAARGERSGGASRRAAPHPRRGDDRRAGDGAPHHGARGDRLPRLGGDRGPPGGRGALRLGGPARDRAARRPRGAGPPRPASRARASGPGVAPRVRGPGERRARRVRGRSPSGARPRAAHDVPRGDPARSRALCRRAAATRGARMSGAALAALLALQAPVGGGAALYGSWCTSCHGADGRGVPAASTRLEVPPADLRDCKTSTAEPEARWIGIVTQGGAAFGLSLDMPAFGEAATPEQLRAGGRYARS